MKTYSIYLSTTSTITPPVEKSNLARVTWSINWGEIFNGITGECRVRAKMVSADSANLTWAANLGSLRATFASNKSHSTNGFNLGQIIPIPNPVTASKWYMDCDTTQNGSSIIIPSGNTSFVVTFLNSTESLMASVPDYNLWLYFDVDD
jgi:hypothetical protein